MYYDIKTKWSPSIELHIDGTLVYLEGFLSHKSAYFSIVREISRKTRKKFENLSEVQEYLQSDALFNYIKELYGFIKDADHTR